MRSATATHTNGATMELDWLLAPPLPAAVPRQRVLYLRLREAVLSGRLPANTCLPASRSLAATLGIARNTVLFAYEQLVAEGCLVADRQGTRVAPLPAAARSATTASMPACTLVRVPRPAGSASESDGESARKTCAVG